MDDNIFKAADVSDLQARKSPVLLILCWRKNKIVSRAWIRKTLNLTPVQTRLWLNKMEHEGTIEPIFRYTDPTRLERLVAWLKGKRVDRKYKQTLYRLRTRRR